ncbi:glycosyl hydrolase [Alteromonas sp. KUL49]|uniref:glycosyl hydrolase n=1 Tax=Alteromonas sp. KUL49 TaxID=2480798 RepID=UPI00102F139D|nr:glycosyl hydrolase [Alteromonas sp. KUL49]TAP42345.1 mannan endo-1,4-beta-mannosidase [Alteromonas sp. KUL49]GEA09957.1 hypothetical protein KUL49_03320 [Alteromonas sp. KUL49]
MFNQANQLTRWFGVSALVVSLTACLGGESLNTETAVYEPESKPLNVIAPEGQEVKPGDSVTLTSRLVGTVSGQYIQWEQVAGPTMDIGDINSDSISFTVPDTVLAATLVFNVHALNDDGSAATDENGDALVDTVSITVFDPDSVVQLDVSDTSTVLNGASLVVEGDDQFILGANMDTHTADLEPGMSVIFNIDDVQGAFTLNVRYAIPSDYGGKMAGVSVNGVDYELSFDATGSWEEIRVGVVELKDGANTIEVGGGWNYYRIDSISLIPSAETPPPKPVVPELVNANATQAAKDLVSYLGENYLNYTLTGQTEFPTKEGDEFPLIETQKILDATGDDAPAVVAFDYMNYSSSYAGGNGSFEGLSESIIKHHNERNIIVSALWHWRAPSGNTATGDGSFYSDGTTFDLAAALADTDSAEYQQLIDDMDIIAVELKKLADADIPVLWRPIHEAEGAWFWWGNFGADTFKDLWVLMYDRYTNTHGLNNLIWTFTHTSTLSNDWYPGDNYVDIVGYDGYAEPRNDTSATFFSQYNTLKDRHDGVKLVALTETGTIPDVTLMHEQKAYWSFFITWNSETWNPDSVIGPQGANPSDIDAFYAGDKVLNLADVPGGREQVSGTYTDFEADTYHWEGQVNWSPTDGLNVNNMWAMSGSMALNLTKDLTTYDAVENVVFQTYPAGGLDVTDKVAINVYVGAVDAGSEVNAHIFYKAGEGDAVQSWPAADALVDGMAKLTISLQDVIDAGLTSLNGLGVRFQGMDATQTAAKFYVDRVETVDNDGNLSMVYDFEPEVPFWHGQINWGPTSGTTLSSAWSAMGGQSFGLYKDLTAYESVDNAVLQAYPEGGIDVTGFTALKVYANAIDAGPSVNAHIFYKAGEGDAYQSWPEATALTDGGTELMIDLTDQTDGDGNAVSLTSLNGMGVRFQSIDGANTQAKFLIDAIMGVNADGNETLLYSFEDTGEFELQINWAPVTGLQLSDAWSASGNRSLAGYTTIEDGQEVILQTYPSGGILLADGVTSLSLTANVADATDGVTAKLWAKDQDGVWRDAGAVAVTSGGVDLSLDISDLNELQGFGVQFQGLTSEHSKFYIDNLVFN